MEYEPLALNWRSLHRSAVVAALVLPTAALVACGDGDSTRNSISTSSASTHSDDSAQVPVTTSRTSTDSDSDHSAEVPVTESTTASTADAANESGCEDFDPQSEPLDAGERVIVEVQIADGFWYQLDLAGNYWISDQLVPPGAPYNGVLTGTAALVEAVRDVNGNILSGRVVVDLGDDGQVIFLGPIFCD